jgi:uncharacterized membrane protein YedE/YeeE
MFIIMVGLTFAAFGLLFGFAFGWLLHRGKVTDYNVIIDQFLLRDFTVLKVMLTAIIVGGIGVLALHQSGWANYHIKDANLLAVGLGASIFGVGMVIYGYCPGTGLAAIGTGSIHALVGAFGMIAGGILYALSFDWLQAHVLTAWRFGKVRLPDLIGIPDLVWLIGLAATAIAFFVFAERHTIPSHLRRSPR